jgi:hypothetical protein
MNFEEYIASRDIKNWTNDDIPVTEKKYLRFASIVAAYPGRGTDKNGTRFQLFAIDSESESKSEVRYFLDPCENRWLADSIYRIISKYSPSNESNKKGIIIFSEEGRHELLIDPIFDSINIEEEFNVFLCETTEKEKDCIGNRFYFDTLGHYIHREDLEKRRTWPLPVGYDAILSKVFKTKPLPENYKVYRVIDPKRYVVVNNDEFILGTINYKGEWLISPKYVEIIYSKNHANAFVRKRIALFNLGQKRKLYKTLYETLRHRKKKSWAHGF